VARIYLGVVLLLSKLVRPRIKYYLERLLLSSEDENGSRKNNRIRTKRSLNIVNRRLVVVVERRESSEKIP